MSKCSTPTPVCVVGNSFPSCVRFPSGKMPMMLFFPNNFLAFAMLPLVGICPYRYRMGAVHTLKKCLQMMKRGSGCVAAITLPNNNPSM